MGFSGGAVLCRFEAHRGRHLTTIGKISGPPGVGYRARGEHATAASSSKPARLVVYPRWLQPLYAPRTGSAGVIADAYLRLTIWTSQHDCLTKTATRRVPITDLRESDAMRPRIAFFDYPDLFEDFHGRYGMNQQDLVETAQIATGHHMFVALVQERIGDVAWYMLSLDPQLKEARQVALGCRIRFCRASALYRLLRWLFWMPKVAWRWRRLYPRYATVASYLSLLSWPLLKALWQQRPDFFLVQDYATGRFDLLVLAGCLFGIPVIAYHTGSKPEWYQAKWIKRWTIPRATCLIPSNQGELDMLAAQYGVAPARLRLILTPIGTDIFRPTERTPACREVGLDPGRRYLLFVGRLHENQKRVTTIIGALATLVASHPDVELVIVGDGPDAVAIQRFAATHLPGKVHFRGWVVDPIAKAWFYNCAECLVLASPREGFPAVVGEALACGTPVLATRVGGVPELVVDGETGWLFEPGDNAALSAKLSFVLRHPEVVASMRPAARRIAETRVSPTRVADQLRECFQGHKPC